MIPVMKTRSDHHPINPCNVTGVLTGLLLSFFLVTPVESRQSSAGTDFLNISPYPSLLAASEASTATFAGSASLYINPSLLSLASNSSTDIAYTLWVSGISNQFAGLNYRTGNHAFALTIYNAESNNLVQPDESLPVSASYLSLASGWGWNLGPIQAGLALHYIREELLDFRANGLALSGGLSAPIMPDHIHAGISLLHIGSMQNLNQTGNPLPSTVRAGFEFTLPYVALDALDALPITVRLHTDYVIPVEKSMTRDFTLNDTNSHHALLGISASLDGSLELRAGIRTGETERRYSLGLGINLQPVDVHYAFIPFSTGYDNAHSIGIRYHFRTF